MTVGPDYCSVNPYFDRPDLPDGKLPFTEVKKKVLVIGGGMAGMQAAITAADIGFDVVLAEKEAELGGIFRFADYDVHKYDLKRFKDRLIRRIEKRSWIELRTNCTVDKAFIEKEKADYIICAIGSSHVVPPIEGLAEHATALLDGYGTDVHGKRVAVLGGGLSACEAAYHFADSGAAEVTVVARRELAPGPLDANKIDLFRGFDARGVRRLTGVQLQSIGDGCVRYAGPEGDGELACDIILYALGMKANPTEALREAAGETPFETIGDCVEPTKVYHAIYDGVSAAIHAWKHFNHEENT